MITAIQSFLDSPGLMSILGVVVGLIVGEGVRWLRELLRVRRLKGLLKEELRSLNYQASQKVDILKKMREALRNEQVLSGSSVRMIQIGYDRHFPELYEHLSCRQRNCLWMIHERFKKLDAFMESFADELKSDISEKIMDSPFDVYGGWLDEKMESLDVVDKLIASYLAGKPTDVFHLELDNRPNSFS